MKLSHPIRNYQDLENAKKNIEGERQALQTFLKEERWDITRSLSRNWFLTETGIVLVSRLAEWGVRLSRHSRGRPGAQNSKTDTSRWVMFFLEIAQELGPVLVRKWTKAREGSMPEQR